MKVRCEVYVKVSHAAMLLFFFVDFLFF